MTANQLIQVYNIQENILEKTGKVEKAHDITNRHLWKLSQETHLPCISLLPLAAVRNTSQSLGLSPFELLCGRPFLTND